MKPAPVKTSRVRTWFRRRKEKAPEKKPKEPVIEPRMIRIFTFVITLVGMALGLSFMPLFPQPLPILLAFLVAFVTYKKPRFGMPIGTLLIGLGLLYQLSTLDFIAMLGEPLMREAVIVVLLFLFIAPAVVFGRFRQAIAIDMGIIAAFMLFSNQTYFLAIPLIIAAAMLFKKNSVLSALYYVLISVPMFMVQYLDYIRQIAAEEWWRVPGASPPIYVPLTTIFKNLQQSMLQFRLYDTSLVVFTIVDQITITPPAAKLTVRTVLTQYLDSLPGIALFLAIAIGAVFAVALVARLFLRGSLSEFERFLPTFMAAAGSAVFLLFLSALQGPLAFRADINGAQIAIGMVAAALFTLPAAFMDYTPKTKATVEMLMEKARELKAKLQDFETLLNKVKTTIPVSVSSVEGKMLVIKDKLDDTLNRTTLRTYDASELDKKFSELDPALRNAIDALFSDLDVTLGEYQAYINCEYSTWLGKFGGAGLEVKATAKIDSQKDQPTEARIDRIKEVSDAGRLLAGEVIQIAEQIYEIIRSLYDANLPEKSQTVVFAKQKLDESAPWSALDALFTAFNNWKKQYGTDIARSAEALQNTLAPIASLHTQSERLLPVLSDDLSKLIDDARKAEAIKLRTEKPLSIISVITIRDTLQTSLSIAREVLSIIYGKLESTEAEIDSLLPTKDYLWERNDTLQKRMATAMEIICDSGKYKLNEVLENLPKALADLNECVETVVKYAEKKEFLLNYPIAEMAIEDLLKQKKRIAAHDLPFEPKFAEEYLKLFYSQRFGEFSFDDENQLLARRA